MIPRLQLGWSINKYRIASKKLITGYLKIKVMKNYRFIILVLFLMLSSLARTQVVSITPENIQRAKDIVSRMTLEEKLDYIGGYNGFSIRAIPRLGLPEIKMSDGPQGLRNDTKSTLYPSGILSSSTWNRII